MTKLEAQAEGEPPPKPFDRSKWLLISIIVILGALITINADGLVERVPLPYAITTSALGAGSGLYGVLRITPRLERQGWRGVVAMFVLPLFALFIGSWVGRYVYEVIAFVGVTPSEKAVLAPIVDMTSGRSGPRAIVKIDPASRELRVSVTHDLYAQLDTYRYPGRDCLILMVQTGRFGVRRALIPSLFSADVGLEKLRPCAPS